MNNRATTPTTPTITAVLFISCCGVFFYLFEFLTTHLLAFEFLTLLALGSVPPLRLYVSGLKDGFWAGLFLTDRHP